jgi:hypothetical protein
MGLRFARTAAGGLNYDKNFNTQGPAPDYDGYPVTPSDTVNLSNGPCRALNVTTAGNVAVNLVGGGTATLTGLSAGQIIEVAAQRVLATGTTAAGIFALYNGG